ncbi:MAG TPA: hypothetical protein VGM07_16805 [Stellaceae bacterium]|jgi:hypothetical protein
MHVRTRGLPIVALAVVAALCLYRAEPAWAGDGGEDAGTVQGFLNLVCSGLGLSPCPQLPTVSQGVLELAGLLNARPEAVRAGQDVPGSAVYAGNVAISPPPSLASLTPLAFRGAMTGRGQATPTQLYDPAADSFFYAVTTFGTVEGNSQPQTLNLFYDYLLRTVPVFIKGQTVAKISLPLTVLNSNGTERFVCGARGCPASEATLQITATCTGGPACLAGTVSGDFAGSGTQQSYPAADLGVAFGETFGASPISKLPHATFAVRVPLIVTNVNDAPYFAFNNIANAQVFIAEDTGFLAPVLGDGVSVGIPPYAAPPCSSSAGTACPMPTSPTTPPPPPSSYGFCASFSNNFTGPIGNPAPAVAAFVQIGTDGETLASTPLPRTGASLAECPF